MCSSARTARVFAPGTPCGFWSGTSFCSPGASSSSSAATPYERIPCAMIVRPRSAARLAACTSPMGTLTCTPHGPCTTPMRSAPSFPTPSCSSTTNRRLRRVRDRTCPTRSRRISTATSEFARRTRTWRPTPLHTCVRKNRRMRAETSSSTGRPGPAPDAHRWAANPADSGDSPGRRVTTPPPARRRKPQTRRRAGMKRTTRRFFLAIGWITTRERRPALL